MNMEMLMLKRYGIPEFYVGNFIRPDRFCFYVIQYFPVAFITNIPRTRTIFKMDSVFVVECNYKREKA